MNKNNKRQGDIVFIEQEINLSDYKKIADRTFVVAEGESTGHNHTITAETGTVEVYAGKNGEMVISVNGKAVLTHPEHKTLEFKTGVYKVEREQEFDYFQLSTRKVID